MTLAGLTVKNIGHNWLRTVLTIMVVVIAVFMFVLIRTTVDAFEWSVKHGAQDRLYRNDGGGRLVDATLLMPAGSARSVGVAVADVEGDGDLDMLVTTETGGPDRLLVASAPWQEENEP